MGGARKLLFSGYPLFPSTAVAAPVAWRVPKADVASFYDVAVFFSEDSPTLISEGEWIRLGIGMAAETLGHDGSIRMATRPRQFVDVAIVGSCLEKSELPAKARPLAPNDSTRGIGLVMWFFTAPNPRYLGSITWLLPLSASLALISDISLSARAFVALAFCVNYFALARCATIPNGRGRNGLLESRKYAESIFWRVTIPLASVFTTPARASKPSMRLSRARRPCIPR